MDPVLVRNLAERLRARRQEELVITYDQDDFLGRLMEPITADLGLDFQTATAKYNIRENPALTSAEREAIFLAFANPKYFQEIDFYDGIEDIMLPCELSSTKIKVKVGVNTHSFTQTISDLKIEQLLDRVRKIQREDIQANVISANEGLHKTHVRIPTILGEDSPYNVACSPALLNIMPETIDWACNNEAREIIGDKLTVWQPSLTAINHYVYELVEAVLTAI